MEFIILGLLIWTAVHMIPVVAPELRNRLITQLGEWPYKGAFSLAILGSVALIVIGWRAIDSVTPLYDIYDIAVVPALLAILCGFVLMAAANLKTNFSRRVRHPQLTGFSLWALAHLALNGDLRTVVLFGGLAVWAIATIFLLNKRDGAFSLPEKQLPHKGVIAVALGFCLFIAAVLGHEYLSGVDLTSR